MQPYKMRLTDNNFSVSLHNVSMNIYTTNGFVGFQTSSRNVKCSEAI